MSGDPGRAPRGARDRGNEQGTRSVSIARASVPGRRTESDGRTDELGPSRPGLRSRCRLADGSRGSQLLLLVDCCSLLPSVAPLRPRRPPRPPSPPSPPARMALSKDGRIGTSFYTYDGTWRTAEPSWRLLMAQEENIRGLTSAGFPLPQPKADSNLRGELSARARVPMASAADPSAAPSPTPPPPPPPPTASSRGRTGSTRGLPTSSPPTSRCTSTTRRAGTVWGS